MYIFIDIRCRYDKIKNVDSAFYLYVIQGGKNMKLKSKSISFMTSFAILATAIAPVAAATVSVAGGTWDYGVNDKIVWSYYQHTKKEHKASVEGFLPATSGWKKPGVKAKAEAPKSAWTNRSYYDVR